MRGGSRFGEQSANMENVDKFRTTNEGLQNQLKSLDNKLSGRVDKKVETDKIF